MPAGLDGNPDPIRSPARDAVLVAVARHIDSIQRETYCLVGVDGEAGSGKSTFADELAALLHSGGRSVVRSTVDSFHNPRAVRYRNGNSSGEGYYRDSHNLTVLIGGLLDPFSRGAPFRTACFDAPSDRPVDARPESAAPASILMFDGLFLHRPELRNRWDCSVFLDAPKRIADRRRGWEVGASLEDVATARSRYVDGWQLYRREAEPAQAATFVVLNEDFANPEITRFPRES